VAPRGSIECTIMRWFITATRAVNFAAAKISSVFFALASGSGFGPGQSIGDIAGRLRPQLRRAVGATPRAASVTGVNSS